MEHASFSLPRRPTQKEAIGQQAVQAGVADRVEFHVMDALLMLEFPNNFFDLVNERFGSSFLRTWDWLKFLEKCRRVTRYGGSSVSPNAISPRITAQH